MSGLELATGRSATPDVTVEPDSASLALGGGDGSNSTGDVALQDGAANARVQLTGGVGSKQDPGENRVFVDGAGGRIELGERRTGSGGTDIELVPADATAILGGGDGSSSDGEVLLAATTGEERIHLDTSGGGPLSQATDVYVSGGPLSGSDRKRALDETPVTVDGSSGHVDLGGGDRPGLLTLARSEDVGGTYETARLQGQNARLVLGGGPGEANRGGGEPGSIHVRNAHEVTVCDVDGTDATMRIGSEGKDGSDRGAQNGAVEVVHESGVTTAELRGREGSVVAGGKNTSGAVLLKHEDAGGNVVQYLLEANQAGLVVSARKTTAGSGGNVTTNEAFRVEPDGTVRVKGGTVKPL